MNFKGWRLQFVILASFLSLILLTGGYWFYRYFSQEKPLTSALMNEAGVQSVDIYKSTDGLKVKVALGPVADLQGTYQQLETKITETYSQQAVKLLIEDSRSTELENIWLAGQYVIYEAAVRGNFTQMASTLEQLIQQAEIQGYAVSIDEKNIYLQLSQGDNYLYQIIPRQTYLLRGEM